MSHILSLEKSTVAARFARLTLVIAALATLTGCLRPWADAAPEQAVKRPQPTPVVTTLKDDSPGTLLAPASITTNASGPRTITVTENDTLYRIAWREDVALQSLVEANKLSEPYVVVPGQELTVPNLPDYVVKADDTLYAISRCSGVAVDALARTNGLDAPFIISPGQRLRIPERSRTPNCADGQPVIAAAEKPQSSPMHLAVANRPNVKPAATKAVQKVALPTRTTRIAEPPPRGGAKFLWPVDGEVVSTYGPKQGARQNNGINIAAKPGTPVRASENGIVVYAGNELRGYGNLLLVRHADGWTSAYAHNGEILVDRGTEVKRGQIIAKVGNTGSVNTPQSHFELRKGAKAVDPVKYLSPR